MRRKKWSEEQLIVALRSQDPDTQNEAMKHLIHKLRYDRKVERIVRGIMNSVPRHELEDFTEICLVDFFYNINEGYFKKDSGLATYFTSFVKRQWYKYYRDKMKPLRPFLEYRSQILEEPEFGIEIEKLEAMLASEIAGMSLKCQKVLNALLRDLDDNEQLREDLGYELDSSVNTLRFKCRKKLRQRCMQVPELAECINTI